MAEIPNSPNTDSPPAPKRGQEFLALVALGATALICFSLMAIGLTLILNRGNNAPSITVNPVISGGSPTNLPASNGSFAGIQRGAELPKPQGERMAAMDRTQPALPGVLASPTPFASQRKLALTRADPPSPPSPAIQATPDPKKVFFRVRADPANLYQGQKALPMPVRYVPDAHGKVAEIYAAREPMKADERFSYAPDVVFAESGTRGQALDVQLTEPRKTSTVAGFRAPKGFQFFTAKLRLANQGARPMVLNVDDIEVHDSDGLRYLANPELVVGTLQSPALEPAGVSQIELSFLVPETSPLKELAVQEAPGQMALVPLLAR